ncbi:carboxypeptidase-like regulatory domain-containing protein [Nocardiopsis nanhaiensis]
MVDNVDDADRGSTDSGMLAVTGTVHDRTGDPVEGVHLSWKSRDDPPVPASELGVGTSEDGSYRIPLPPGTWEIQGAKGDVGTGAETVLLEGGVVTVDLHFTEPLPAE